MNRTSLFAATAVVFLSVFGPVCDAQPRLAGQWSITVEGGPLYPLAAMRGTLSEFHDQFVATYANRRYPFGDIDAISLGWGGQLAYRFPESHWSPYIGIHVHVFTVPDLVITRDNNAFDMALFTWSAGAEYTIGAPSERWNAFARLGLNASFIGGEIIYDYYNATQLTYAVRGGAEAEIGARYNLTFLPGAVEIGLGYINANLIGKSYIKPELLSLSTELRDRGLNDAANLNDPGDASRSLAFLSLHFGGRIWL